MKESYIVVIEKTREAIAHDQVLQRVARQFDNMPTEKDVALLLNHFKVIEALHQP